MSIVVTPEASQEIIRVLSEQQLDTKDTVLRIGVGKTGGYNFAYSMTFDKKENVNPLNDVTYNFDGLSLVVSRQEEAQLDGATVDFVDSMYRRGFIFDNPNVDLGGCGSGGCGSGQVNSGGCGSGGCGSGGCGV